MVGVVIMDKGKSCEGCKNADGKRLVVRFQNLVRDSSAVLSYSMRKSKERAG